ncbi:MAG: helical backbone metal receptor [Proteobacteria bacterium]|nr:helical backbone metal receptor [Pseudomonadota bacterium]
MLRAALALAFSLLASVAHSDPARRVVSINPSLTAILIALGAGDSLVGVDDFSARQQAQVAGLPLVGGLFSPSLEAVVALEPDLVVLVPSVEQRDFRERLAALGFRVEVFDNIRFEQVLENIERLGRLVGRDEAAAVRVAEIRRARRVVGELAAKRTGTGPRPRTLLVMQRDPVFVVGSGSFLDDMLRVVGAENLGASFGDPYPRVAVEWVLAAAPEVLLDMSPDADAPEAHWSRWSSLPAVKAGRVLRLDQVVTLPGPDLDRSLVLLATALHGRELGREIAAALDEPLPVPAP